MGDDTARGLLEGFPVVVEIPVMWSDMDYNRHVTNTAFFRYFESARIEYLERIGFRRHGGETGVGPILSATDARFRRPLEWPDTVLVGARTVEVLDDRFHQAYRLVSRALGEVAAEGGGTLVAYDYARRRKTALPDAVREAIREIER